MSLLLLRLLGMSLWGSAAALSVWAVCALLRRAHAPAGLLKLLWLAAAARFVCPFAVSVPLPRPRAGAAAIAADAVQRQYAAARLSAAALAGPDPISAPAPGAAAAAAAPAASSGWVWQLLLLAWALGFALLALRCALAALRLHRRVALACKTPDGAYTCAGVELPFTLGFPRPRIYLPPDLTGPDRAAVLRHEQAHTRRGDTLLKPLCYLIACLHWWNPLAWFTFRQFCREMEAACDEAATRGLDLPGRAAYCKSLYRFAARGLADGVPCALAFGESPLRGRIARVLRYRRPAALALAACIAAAALTLCACMARPVFAPADAAPAAGTPAPESAAAPAGQPEQNGQNGQTGQPGQTGETAGPAPTADPAGLDQLAGETAALQSEIAKLNTELYALSTEAQKGGDRPDDEIDALTRQRTDLLNELLALVEPACEPDAFLCPTAFQFVSRTMSASHKGADLCAEHGTPVYAVAGGIVRAAEFHSSYGNHVVVEHGTDADGSAWTSLYAHLDTLMVQAGDVVLPGEQLGTVGSTGNATGNALHLELRRDGTLMQPGNFIELTEGAALQLDVDALAYQSALTAGADAPEFVCPLGSYEQISCYYSVDGHPGVDFAAATGTPVGAAAAGTVEDAGSDTENGNYVLVNHGAGSDGRIWSTLYAHLDELTVAAGQAVEPGQQIGTVGNSGNSTGSHLHLELRVNGRCVDPFAHIPH